MRYVFNFPVFSFLGSLFLPLTRIRVHMLSCYSSCWNHKCYQGSKRLSIPTASPNDSSFSTLWNWEGLKCAAAVYSCSSENSHTFSTINPPKWGKPSPALLSTAFCGTPSLVSHLPTEWLMLINSWSTNLSKLTISRGSCSTILASRLPRNSKGRKTDIQETN